MEPSDSSSTTMEEPDSLEVLVKTLDSQTRTFIVGAQVRETAVLGSADTRFGSLVFPGMSLVFWSRTPLCPLLGGTSEVLSE